MYSATDEKFASSAIARLTVVDSNGIRRELSAEPGETVLDAALRHAVPELPGDCLGASICATCHVYVEDEWLAAVGTASGYEREVLGQAYGVAPNSRLACRITMREKLDGLVLRTPSRQPSILK